MKVIRALALTLFVFGLIGFLYIVLSATFHPQTLTMQLTHFADWPREDTFGEASFAISFISFFIWNLVKEK